MGEFDSITIADQNGAQLAVYERNHEEDPQSSTATESPQLWRLLHDHDLPGLVDFNKERSVLPKARPAK
jgi:hypothetical protein